MKNFWIDKKKQKHFDENYNENYKDKRRILIAHPTNDWGTAFAFYLYSMAQDWLKQLGFKVRHGLISARDIKCVGIDCQIKKDHYCLVLESPDFLICNNTVPFINIHDKYLAESE